jgi:hypothetical protein
MKTIFILIFLSITSLIGVSQSYPDWFVTTKGDTVRCFLSKEQNGNYSFFRVFDGDTLKGKISSNQVLSTSNNSYNLSKSLPTNYAKIDGKTLVFAGGQIKSAGILTLVTLACGGLGAGLSLATKSAIPGYVFGGIGLGLTITSGVLLSSGGNNIQNSVITP